jgi:hypothetical protein
MSTDNTYRILVRDKGEWGEFFVHERAPLHEEDGSTRYAASWTCLSSFGVYGHHWSHMGEPFAAMIAHVGKDYLLGKIARKRFDERKFKRAISREIFTSRGSREQKSAAFKRLKELCLDYDRNSLSVMAYEDSELNAVNIDWCEVDCQDWTPDALGFVDRLWPKFVSDVNTVALFTAADPAPEKVNP